MFASRLMNLNWCLNVCSKITKYMYQYHMLLDFFKISQSHESLWKSFVK